VLNARTAAGKTNDLASQVLAYRETQELFSTESQHAGE